MRHLSLQLIIAALILSACDMGKPKPTVERTSYTQESVAPVNSPVSRSTADMTTTRTRDVSRPEVVPVIEEDEYSEGALVPEDEMIQAEEEDVRKTYNESQISDEESDYPLEKSDHGEPYNETQLTR